MIHLGYYMIDMKNWIRKFFHMKNRKYKVEAYGRLTLYGVVTAKSKIEACREFDKWFNVKKNDDYRQIRVWEDGKDKITADIFRIEEI